MLSTTLMILKKNLSKKKENKMKCLLSSLLVVGCWWLLTTNNILLTNKSYAQTDQKPPIQKIEINPDGDNVSFHFAPYLTDTQIFSNGKEYRSDQEFCYNFLIKIPIDESFTASVFYNSESAEFKGWSFNEPLKADKQSYGLTLSVYLH